MELVVSYRSMQPSGHHSTAALPRVSVRTVSMDFDIPIWAAAAGLQGLRAFRHKSS